MVVLPIWAGFISLSSSLSSEVTPSGVKVVLDLKNNGGEDAFNIQAKFMLAGKHFLSQVIPKLEVNQSIKIACPKEFRLEKQGCYPLTAKIQFQDAAGYPFSTVVVNPFVYEKTAVSSVFGELEDLILSGKDRLRLRLKNLGYQDLNLDIDILVPDELSVIPKEKRFRLKARSKEEISFELNNFSALEGSVYPVWAVMEYEMEDKHFSHVCSGDITVEQKKNIIEKYWWAWLSLAALMIIVLVWRNLMRKRSCGF